MNFETQAQQACYEKIAPMIKEIFGDFVHAMEERPVFFVTIGSAAAQIIVSPWGKDDAVVNTRSFVVSGAEITPDLMEYLLRENPKMLFGAFGVDSDNDIVFEHAIVASTCDREELKSTVMAVVTTADRYDDEIIAKWGGQRAVDRSRSAST